MIANNNDSWVRLSDILAAQKVIAGQVNRTPLIASPTLGARIGSNLHFKAEVFQITGSFKPRGALYKLHNLTNEEKERGVITISAGNHAQGLAYAASLLGINATVIMPQAAVKTKVQATKGYGAEVIQHGTGKDLLPKCREVMEERNLTLVHPFDDPFIIAGQGTIGLEILEDLPAAPEVVVVPVGGGGLISGIATALKSRNPAIKVIGVEPIGAAAMSQSLQKNAVVSLEKLDTIADGLAAPFAGKHTLAHVQKYVDEIVIVSDDEIRGAIRLILEQNKILTEPAGAAGFAALLYEKISLPKDALVVCVLSGGNIDRSLLKEILLRE
ncbi:MAG: threonine/serine dehydratase [Candidatus Hodarchaeales archaeon]|jgi:threonine dehydratase